MVAGGNENPMPTVEVSILKTHPKLLLAGFLEDLSIAAMLARIFISKSICCAALLFLFVAYLRPNTV
jgi:hypothetical protein